MFRIARTIDLAGATPGEPMVVGPAFETMADAAADVLARLECLMADGASIRWIDFEPEGGGPVIGEATVPRDGRTPEHTITISVITDSIVGPDGRVG